MPFTIETVTERQIAKTIDPRANGFAELSLRPRRAAAEIAFHHRSSDVQR
jgi:hypothetical protein